MLNTISNTPSTSFIQRGAKASSIQEQENKEIQEKNREMIRHWLKEPKDYLSITSGIDFFRHIETIKAREATARIKITAIEEYSQKFTNVSEESYQSAKAYIYKQMEDIALAVYEEEGKSDLFSMLMWDGGSMKFIDMAGDIKENELESSAREFVASLKTTNKERIVEAQGKLEDNLVMLRAAHMIAFASVLRFFTLADTKIPAENFQKIKDSLGIMESYMRDNFLPNEQGIIKTKNGLIIESSEEKGIRTLKITLPFDKVENLILNYKDKNHQTLLEMFEYKEKLSKDSSINSKDSLIQTLLKESKEERKEY
ncbi:hypothetical protein [Helicobacter mesocricetorum]|uniref:hypothetical protein n=1 Tax=Helicobacter mesocricetorum TaxID=87012 RepID=UPI000CF17C46|nr:hypothetical protein [Helicobacter mesocricetorum]